MDYESALSELIDAIADVEEHGDAIEFLQSYSNERENEDDSTWEEKYKKLESEYKKRFKEGMLKSANNADPVEKEEKKEKVTVESLDFNGKTE